MGNPELSSIYPTPFFSRFSIMAYAITPRNLYKYKLGKIIMTGICIGISYEK